jgi:hypothetical protein
MHTVLCRLFQMKVVNELVLLSRAQGSERSCRGGRKVVEGEMSFDVLTVLSQAAGYVDPGLSRALT